jgi:hypothetical protein
MEWWYIIWGIFLSWSLPWTILRLTDGMFLLNQIFRLVYWMGFFITYEMAELNFVYCLILAHIPGGLIWACYENWFCDGDDDPQKIGDEFEVGIPIKSVDKSDSLIVWNIPETPTA